MKKLLFSLICGIIGVFSISYAQGYKDLLISKAEAGDLNSQKFLAEAYYKGDGIYSKNYKESLKWLKMAADQGDAESEYRLYWCYKNGVGSEGHLDIHLLFDAAEKKYTSAMLEVGGLLSQMLGKEEDGREMFLEAYSLGDTRALPGIAANYATAGEYSQAFNYYSLAIKECTDQDYRAGGYMGLALLYGAGDGVEENINLAHDMIDKAIQLTPKDPRCYEYKGMLFLRQGKMEKAAQMWNKVIDTSLVYAQKSTSELARAMNHSVDYGIPVTTKRQNNTYAIVIANENYKRVPNVPFAHNDGKIFRQYLISSFGIPEENIEYLEDASLNDIKYALTNVSQRCNAFKDQVSVIVYYAGHGVPDDKTAEAFLLPVDGFGTDPSSGLNLDDFYASLSEMPAKSIIVLMDACFSGAKRDGGMLLATRGITIKPKIQVPDGKLIVLSATSNNETAFPIEQQNHGLFTYTLLRKIQETGGDITWGELTDYVTETVKNSSIDLIGKLQTPTVSVSLSMKDVWRNIKIR